MAKKELVDLSWVWHCTSDPKNVLDYYFLVEDKIMANALNHATAQGARGMLNKLSDLGLFELGDINRSPNKADQEMWDATFKEDDE